MSNHRKRVFERTILNIEQAVLVMITALLGEHLLPFLGGVATSAGLALARRSVRSRSEGPRKESSKVVGTNH